MVDLYLSLRGFSVPASLNITLLSIPFDSWKVTSDILLPRQGRFPRIFCIRPGRSPLPFSGRGGRGTVAMDLKSLTIGNSPSFLGGRKGWEPQALFCPSEWSRLPPFIPAPLQTGRGETLPHVDSDGRVAVNTEKG